MQINSSVKVEDIIKSGVNSLKISQNAHCSERNPKNEIAEANLTHHISASFIKYGYNLYAEFPVSKGRLLDLVAFSDDNDEWIAIEAKGYLHSNQEKVLADFKRLEEISNEDWTEGTKVKKVILVMNRHPKLSTWWKTRGTSSLDGIQAIEKEPGLEQFSEIKLHLEKSEHVDSFQWYPPEKDWVYEVLYAIS
ncbi:MAG: hypothetical protein RPS47_12775 [Colwellia sp.]